MTKEESEVQHIEELSWTELDSFSREHTLIFIPISPLEEHGPHLPIGTDFLVARDAAIKAIQQIQQQRTNLTGLLYPPLAVGSANLTCGFPGTITTTSRTLTNIIYDTISSLARHHFKYFIICTYHMDLVHLKGIYRAMNKAKRTYPHIHITEPWAPYFHSNSASIKEPDPGFDTSKEVHADFRETSLVQYLYPYHVRPIYKELQTQWADLYSPKVLGKNLKGLGLKQGYVGTPCKANPDYGRWFFNETVNAYSQGAISLLDGKPLPSLPKKTKRLMKALFWK